MDALCVVHAGGSFSPSPDIGSFTAVLKRHSSTITELNAKLPGEMTESEVEEVSSALACCTRLESLTGANSYGPAVWLGLSHLHTLCGVDLRRVSLAAIAAALPKLHTLKAFGYCNDPAQAAHFTTGLLTRLRVFHFYGRWPDAQERPATTVAPLPLLQELVWNVAHYEIMIPREFLGAQPTVLHAPYALISWCWPSGINGPARFLARVCDLLITSALDVDPLDPTDVAQVLRAAPQLKKFHTAHCVQGDASWLAPTAPTHAALEGLVHPRLREFGIAHADSEHGTSFEANPPDAEWVTQLRRRHFPRLRALIVDNEEYFVTPSDYVLLETGAAPSEW
jgi:hypothetical protein